MEISGFEGSVISSAESGNLPPRHHNKPIAFLILAHHEPKLLARLLSRLSADWAHFFVHVDRKVDIEQFQNENLGNGVTFLPQNQRIDVHWCGYSMIAATLNLIHCAAASTARPTRFVLMSGVDYPIKPIDRIGQVLSGDEEFIQIDRQIDPTGTSQFDRCLNRRYLGDNSFLNRRSRLPVIPGLVRKIEQRWVRSHPKGLKVFYGPQWWSLTGKAVTEVLAYIDNNPTVVKWFTGVRTPDESMFHTILKTTSRSANIAYDATRLGEQPFGANRHALHYVDWTNPNPSLPRTLELSDLDALTQSGALFARKMSSSRSSALLDALDEVCLKS